MNDYVGMLKKMADMTIGHTNNVMRITEGMCNGGVALVTDKEGNQGIFTPATRKGSFKSLEMFKKMAEKNGLAVNVIRPDWAKDEESKVEKKSNKDNQKTVKNDHESDDSSNQTIDPSVIGDLDIEVDEDSKKAKVKGHGVDREISVKDINAYHAGLLDACAMLGIDIPKFLNGEGEVITKEEVTEFLNTKEGKKVVSEVVAKLTGELVGEAKTNETKEAKKEKKVKKEDGKKVPYQFKELDEKSRDFLNKHIKLQELDDAMAGEDFDDKRRNYIKNVIISEIEWAYKRGDKFFPKEDDFVKFEVENISKNNVIYLKRPDIRMVIVPFRWDRKIYRIFARSEDEAKNISEINAWIEGKIREEEVRNQEEAAVSKEAEKATENETAAK